MKILFGNETVKAVGNFPFFVPHVRKEFIVALVEIKKAAAVANCKAGNISKEISEKIIVACDEILTEKHNDQFPLPWLQGGAGTSTNMNVNEVIARIADCHPLDHVNRSQSTNDANPSALRIAVIRLCATLKETLEKLAEAFEKKSEEFKDVVKLGRTHLQDAVPTTLGAEFGAYAVIVRRHLANIKTSAEAMHRLNLGGTAIGSGINASHEYVVEVYAELCKITGLELVPADNLMAQTSNQTDFLVLSQAVTAFCVSLSKIAGDLRLMAGGPKGGFGEINIRELQNGSSIMPGKVNPILPEAVNQLYFIISGNNITIEQCAHAAQLELGVMLPTITERLLETLTLASQVTGVFASKCVATITANPERCIELLEQSSASATALVPDIGYDKAADVVKEKFQ